MVQVEKNGIVLLIPKASYEVDYKDNGWKIVGDKKEKVAPIEPIKKEEVNDSKSLKNNRRK